MNLKTKALVILTPIIIIPVLLVGGVSASKLRQATEARLSTSITTLLDQVSRQSYDSAFVANQGRQASNDDSQNDLSSLNNFINTSVIGESGYLLLINAAGEIVAFPENIARTTVEENLRLLSEKIRMEDSKTRTEIRVDEKIIFSYWKELASGQHMIAFLPKDDVIKASCDQAKIIYGLSLVAALFIAISALVLLRYWVSKPIDALNTAADKFVNDEMNMAGGIKTKDEIDRLSKSFNTLANKLQQTYEEATYIANHDSLTGLPNRDLFNDYLKNIIAIAHTKKHSVALLFVALDNLGQINTDHGNEGGDAVLKEMALRLNNSLRKHHDGAKDLHDKSFDIVSRYGGDEFIVLLDKIEGAWDATVVADRIFKSLHLPVMFNNDQVVLNFNIGITIYPDDSQNAQELIKNSDIAMYRAKKHGSNNYQFFSDTTDTEMHKHLRIHSRLRAAIDENQFFMEYQPKYNADSGDIVGMEALIRWQDPEDGLISPDDFLPVAEDSGLLSEITKWSINNVCKQGMDWYSSGRLTVPVAINLSVIEFKRFDLLATLKNCLKETGLPPELIEFELSEASLHADPDGAIEILDGMKKSGINLAINGFGTGYSSLSILKRLPINTLKIDRSFIAEIRSTDESYGMVNGIISLGHDMGFTTVADGVETEVQRDYLKSKACDVMQGFLFDRPLSIEDMAAKLDELQTANL